MQNEPRLDFLYTITAELAAPIAIGECPHGNRQIVPVTGGSFEGPHLKGTVLAGGGDWLLVRPDGVGELDVRATLQTDDGALVYVTYRGYLSRIMELIPRWAAGEEIPREEYYFAVTPYFETGAPQYAWLQQTIAIGIGQLVRGAVAYDVYAVGSRVGTSPLPQAAAAATA
jgi:hypothetical protein